MRSWAAESMPRRLLTSIGLVAAWAGLTGLGTFATFPDRTTALGDDVETGRVSLGVRTPELLGSLPVSVGALVPGGSAVRTIDLVNDGDVPLSTVVLTSVAGMSSRLDADPHGLQLTVHACSVAWTAEGVCSGDRRIVLPSGPVVRSASLDDPASLHPGGTDHLAVTITLPDGAGNEFAGQRSAVDLTFTGVQRSGSAR